MLLERTAAATCERLARGFPILGIFGPRQSGKTTLSRVAFPDKSYVSLEDPDELDFSLNDPRGFLSRFGEGAVIDEAQRCPALFSYLQGIADEAGRMGHFVLTGSQNFLLSERISQSLAGRVGIVELLPFSATELQQLAPSKGSLTQALYLGGYPALYDRDMEATDFFASYVRTYVEQDVRSIANVTDLSLFRRFLRLCAGRVGQLLNLTSLGNDCGISHTTARAWMSVLEASYLVHLLPPHHENFNKRLVKTPKLYFLDTGLAAWLLDIDDPSQLETHYARGALFESYVVSELLKSRLNAGQRPNTFFWRNNTGDEIDIVIAQGSQLRPLEVKSASTFNSSHIRGLKRWCGWAGNKAHAPSLVYGGDTSYVREGIRVYAWRDAPWDR